VAMKRISLSIKALIPERQREKPVHREREVRPPKPSRPQRAIAAVAEARGNSKQPQKISSPSTAAVKETHSRKPPVTRRNQLAKKFTKPLQKTEAKEMHGMKTEPRKHESSPSFSSLPFDEQIRLLQEKFSGIR